MSVDLNDIEWLKSSYSQQGGNCVEWAPAYASATGTVPVRDSKDPGRPGLRVPAPVFTSFMAGVKADGFSTL
ncbi:DUF397 domain-containing protein [Streptomyces sp. JNUCC 64]